jgi:hypothetical protein
VSIMVSIGLFPRTRYSVTEGAGIVTLGRARCRVGVGWFAIGVAIATVWSGVDASGDELWVDGDRLERVRIMDLERGEISYATPDGEFRRVRLSSVERVLVDSVGTTAYLNEAELRASGGDFVRSISQYERAVRTSDGFWKRLSRARLVRAADEADRVDLVATHFAAIVGDEPTGLELAADILPVVSPTASSRGVTRGLRVIGEASARARSQSARVLLDMLRYHILSRTDAAKSLVAAGALVDEPIPQMIASRGVYGLKRRAMERLVVAGEAERVVRIANAELSTAPRGVLAEMLLVKSRALLSQATDSDGLSRAGWAAMRIVIHFEDDPLVPAALLIASEVHERMGKNPTAEQLLEECLSHSRLTRRVEDEARSSLARLVAGS